MNSPPLNVMVVEDEALLLDAITKKITKTGMFAIPCPSAEIAIAHLTNNEELPSIIWLDYYLSGGMNGLEFIAALKENPKWEKIKVLVVSNTASANKVKSMLALGASKYLLKSEHGLEDIIAQLVEIHQSDN